MLLSAAAGKSVRFCSHKKAFAAQPPEQYSFAQQS